VLLVGMSALCMLAVDRRLPKPSAFNREVIEKRSRAEEGGLRRGRGAGFVFEGCAPRCAALRCGRVLSRSKKLGRTSRWAVQSSSTPVPAGGLMGWAGRWERR
jgi:hypothetical protein